MFLLSDELIRVNTGGWDLPGHVEELIARIAWHPKGTIEPQVHRARLLAAQGSRPLSAAVGSMPGAAGRAWAT